MDDDVREALHSALFYDDNGKTVFRHSDPRVTTDGDAFIGGLIPAILAAFEVRPHRAVTDAEVEAALVSLDTDWVWPSHEAMRAALKAAREVQ